MGFHLEASCASMELELGSFKNDTVINRIIPTIIVISIIIVIPIIMITMIIIIFINNNNNNNKFILSRRVPFRLSLGAPPPHI